MTTAFAFDIKVEGCLENLILINHKTASKATHPVVRERNCILNDGLCMKCADKR